MYKGQQKHDKNNATVFLVCQEHVLVHPLIPISHHEKCISNLLKCFGVYIYINKKSIITLTENILFVVFFSWASLYDGTRAGVRPYKAVVAGPYHFLAKDSFSRTTYLDRLWHFQSLIILITKACTGQCLVCLGV